MCGGCRVKVGEQSRFACVDGPDFDGHQVDFDDLTARLVRFKRADAQALASFQDDCRMRDAAERIAHGRAKETGSTPGRERGCQHRWMWGGADDVNKKQSG